MTIGVILTDKTIKTKRVIEPRATDEQLAILKELGLNFQKNSISEKKAAKLIEIKHKVLSD